MFRYKRISASVVSGQWKTSNQNIDSVCHANAQALTTPLVWVQAVLNGAPVKEFNFAVPLQVKLPFPCPREDSQTLTNTETET